MLRRSDRRQPASWKAEPQPRKRRLHGLVGGAVGIGLVACFGPPAVERTEVQQVDPSPSREGRGSPGVRFEHGSLDDAIARARRQGTRVFVEVGAAWCPPCRVLHREVLDRPEGAALLRGMVAVELDFDQPANRPVVERYAIISLPTSLVLAPTENGVVEIARVEGYEQKEPWVSAIRAARTAEDPLPGLERAARDRPNDARAAFVLGKSLLARGRSDVGESFLERAVWIGGGSNDALERETAAEALFVLGRYHQRVRRDMRTARHVWRELAGRFPGSPHAATALYWYADAQAAIGQPATAVLAMRLRAEASPTDVDAHLQLAERAGPHGSAADRGWVLDRLRALRRGASGEPAGEIDRAITALEAR